MTCLWPDFIPLFHVGYLVMVWHGYILDSMSVVDLSLLCSFQRMRSHLGVKEADPAKFPADKLAAVAEVLRKSTSLRVSEDGGFSILSCSE